MATDAASTNHEAQKGIALLTERVDNLIREVRGYREEGTTRDSTHSQRLDRMELALAEQKHAEQERARIEALAIKASADVDALKKEQRLWTGGTTVLALLAGLFGIRQP